ncbi:hypothetical protein DVH24_014695 [Malus domestica]|uniref:Uncharacterized protein n=1 Tax=Malus domestica TaxID=3750 RepID=A0A498IAB4_MALDO|nr:hypothetical protein DVH24_014695 [Malus domestica]
MATHVFVPQELFPQKLQVCIKINGLDKVVHNKSESGISNDSVHVQPIKLEEIYVESYNKAKIYKGKKRQLNSSLILCQDIWLIQIFWVLNTRLKSVQGKQKHRWKGPYSITKIHSHRKAIMKDSTIELKCIIDKHQLIPYLLLPYDAVCGAKNNHKTTRGFLDKKDKNTL